MTITNEQMGIPNRQRRRRTKVLRDKDGYGYYVGTFHDGKGHTFNGVFKSKGAARTWENSNDALDQGRKHWGKDTFLVMANALHGHDNPGLFGEKLWGGDDEK